MKIRSDFVWHVCAFWRFILIVSVASINSDNISYPNKIYSCTNHQTYSRLAKIPVTMKQNDTSRQFYLDMAQSDLQIYSSTQMLKCSSRSTKFGIKLHCVRERRAPTKSCSDTPIRDVLPFWTMVKWRPLWQTSYTSSMRRDHTPLPLTAPAIHLPLHTPRQVPLTATWLKKKRWTDMCSLGLVWSG